MKSSKILFIVFVFFILTNLFADKKSEVYNGDYLFYSMSLPISINNIERGQLTLTLKKDEINKETDEREFVILISPVDIECAYKLKNEVITSIKITDMDKIIYDSNLEKEKGNIFQTNKDGIWPKDIADVIAKLLKNNIVTNLDRLKLKLNEPHKIKLKNIKGLTELSCQIIFAPDIV